MFDFPFCYRKHEYGEDRQYECPKTQQQWIASGPQEAGDAKVSKMMMQNHHCEKIPPNPFALQSVPEMGLFVSMGSRLKLAAAKQACVAKGNIDKPLTSTSRYQVSIADLASEPPQPATVG